MTSSDIADLILDQHDEFRRALADIERLIDSKAVRAAWVTLSLRLEVHAAAEEDVFYPAVLRRVEDAEGDTEHAIKDHNEIRETTAKVDTHPVGTDAWWDALRDARAATLEHLDEEEEDVLPPFRRDVDDDMRRELGMRWTQFLARHDDARGLSGDLKDPEEYVEEHS